MKNWIVLALLGLGSLFWGQPTVDIKGREDICRCDRRSDSLALVELYYALGGEHWTYASDTYFEGASRTDIPNARNVWNFNNFMHTWHGVILNRQGCVNSLILSENNLIGELYDIDLPNLQHFYCYGNNLSGHIPDFYMLPNLEVFMCQDNQLEGHIPNFSKLSQLRIFSCSRNKLEGYIPNFSKLPNLEGFYCNSNNIEGTISNFHHLPELYAFVVADNNLSGEVPDFSGRLPKLRNVYINNNQFTFKDIIENIAANERLIRENDGLRNERFYYHPQDNIFADTLITVREGALLEIDLGIDKDLTGNIYTWYFNNDIISMPNRDDNKLIFSAIQISDAGTYHVEVTNPAAADLTLYSYPIRIEVEDFSETGLPIFFSPNDDGTNDQFLIPAIEDEPQKYADSELTVFNRWGQIVYQKKPYKNDWDGTHYKTKRPVPIGIYFYILKPEISGNPTLKEKIKLIR